MSDEATKGVCDMVPGIISALYGRWQEFYDMLSFWRSNEWAIELRLMNLG